MAELPKVVGKIDIPTTPKKSSKCVCADCGCETDNSFGDSRVKITKVSSEGISTVRWVCESCADELFNDSEPKSIFE